MTTANGQLANASADLPDKAARRPQIDGLRALAMLGVLYVHLFDENTMTEGLRVALFFTVSGFLITHILYSAKERGGQINILNFYVRRALRLFPALAILVLVSSIFDIDGFRAEAGWHLLQLSNVRFAMIEGFTPWVAGHLWSLNILEQFYLLWPLVILLLPLPGIYVVTLALIVALSFIRTNGRAMGLDGWSIELLLSGTPIAFGAFAYLLQRHEPVCPVLRSRWSLAASVAVIFAPLFLWEGFHLSSSYRILSMPALGVIVVGAYQGYGGPVGWALGSRLSRYVSQISYAVFMYHLLVWWALRRVFPSLSERGLQTFLVVTAVTIFVAIASWFLVEKPVERLKSRFPTTSRL